MENPTKYLLVVGGPTASGKTSLAIGLARHFSTEILSADSRQFYQEMQIGNARPAEEELAVVSHHFIADRSLQEALSAGEFAREARVVLDQLFEKHDHVVLVGGSGLFIKALTEGLDEFPEISVEVRQRVRDFYEQEGLPALQAAVQAADPKYFLEVDQQNPARLQRALEVCWSSGMPYSSFRKGKQQNDQFVAVYLQPVWPRDQLYARINLRVEQMMEAGLEEEARQLEKSQHLPALQTVGYQEWWPYFAGKATKEEVVQAIQQNSRRYAKRQMTWNRRDGYWKSIPEGDLKIALAYLQLVKKEGLLLTVLSNSTQEEAFFNRREQRKNVTLRMISDGTIQGVVNIVLQKEWAFLELRLGEQRSDLSKVVLVHEACYRAERPKVYTIVDDQAEDWLFTLGWEKTKRTDLPKLLKEMKAEIWVWRRVDVENRFINVNEVY